MNYPSASTSSLDSSSSIQKKYTVSECKMQCRLREEPVKKFFNIIEKKLAKKS